MTDDGRREPRARPRRRSRRLRPCPLERVDDDRAEWHDLEFVADVVGDCAGTIATVGDVVEAKSYYATDDGRAGRWWIRRENHERLLEADGWYVLVVLERDDLTREQRREIAEILGIRAVQFDIETSVSVTAKGEMER